MNVEQTMAQLDTTMDTANELLCELPISNLNKLALMNKVYELWLAVESVVEMELAVDNTR